MCAGFALYLVIAPLIEYPSMTYLIAAILILVGLIFYIPFVWLKWTLPLDLYKKMEILVQKYFEVVPVDVTKTQ